MKLWKITVNHITCSRPRTIYFSSKQAAEECYKNFEYADKPEYAGNYADTSVINALDYHGGIDTSKFKAMYYTSYADYISDN